MTTGLNGSVGYAKETTQGTAVAPTVHLPLLPGESMDGKVERLDSDSIIAGQRVRRSTQWQPGGEDVAGSTPHELYRIDMEELLEAWFGGVSGGTYTPGALAPYTVQKGVPDTAGTVHPLTYAGTMCGGWAVNFAAGEIVTCNTDWVGGKEIGYRTVADGATNTNTTVTSATAVFSADDIGKPISGTGIPAATTITAVASATSVTISAAATATATGVTLTIGLALTAVSYTSGLRPFTYVDGSISTGGTAVGIVKSGTLGGDNKLVDDRKFMGVRYMHAAEGADLREYGGELEIEFADRTQYNRYRRGDEFALVIAFVTGAESLTFTANIRYDGETPKVGSKGVIPQKLPFMCVGSSTDASALTAVLV